jgi:hypothetical protein
MRDVIALKIRFLQHMHTVYIGGASDGTHKPIPMSNDQCLALIVVEVSRLSVFNPPTTRPQAAWPVAAPCQARTCIIMASARWAYCL